MNVRVLLTGTLMLWMAEEVLGKNESSKEIVLNGLEWQIPLKYPACDTWY